MQTNTSTLKTQFYNLIHRVNSMYHANVSGSKPSSILGQNEGQ